MKFHTPAIAGAAFTAFSLFLIAPGAPSAEKKSPFTGRNIAHRGLHSEDCSVPENSLAAFRLAAEAGYGIEFDVQLSKDGQVVVFHDDTLFRVCGIDDRVENRSYDELHAMSLSGTEETIPLLTDVLKIINGRSPIICELKTGKRNRELCEKTWEILSAYPGKVCIESFNPFIVTWFRFHAPEIFRGQLAMPFAEYANSVSRPLAFLLSCTGMNFLARPNFIAYEIGKKPFPVKAAEAMGAFRVAWTSHSPQNEQGNDCVIFEYYKPDLIFRSDEKMEEKI